MNISAGFRAAGQGLELMAKNAARREENEWEAMRQENLENLRHKHNLDAEGVRAKNDADAAEKERGWRSGESKADRDAALERVNISERGANARIAQQERKNDTRELAEARRHRTSTLQAFRAQYSKALGDLNDAKASGTADENDLAEMAANIQYIAREMQDFDAQSKDTLASLGDPWAKAQLLSDEDMENLMGGGGGEPGQPAADKGAPGGKGPAKGKPKPLAPKSSKSSTGSGFLRDETTPSMRDARPGAAAPAGLDAVAAWAGGVDSAAAQQRQREEEEARRRGTYSPRPTREQLAGAGHSTAPRLIP